MLHFFFFFLKKKKYILHLCTKNLDNMIYCSWDIQCDRPKLIITGHLLSFHISYGSWDMLWDRQNFFSFWTIFCPFTPTPPTPSKNTENQNFDKTRKKTAGDIIILHKCTINYSHMIYGPRDIKHNIIFCPFGPFFALLPS